MILVENWRHSIINDIKNHNMFTPIPPSFYT